MTDFSPDFGPDFSALPAVRWIYGLGPGPSITIGSASSTSVAVVARGNPITITSYFYPRETRGPGDDPGGYMMGQQIFDPNGVQMGASNFSPFASITAGVMITTTYTYAIPVLETTGVHTVAATAFYATGGQIICTNPTSMTFLVI